MPRLTKAEQKKNRQKWIRALRSGKYKQAKGELKRPKGYCCLGVACEISKLGEWVKECGRFTYKTPREHSESATLPNRVKNWMGLDDCTGSFDEGVIANGHLQQSLTSLNDGGGWTFEQIADFIAKEPKGLIK